MHIPYQHPDAFAFLDAVNEKYKPDKVVCMGDEIDNHAVSFHDHDPDLLSPSSELEKAIFHLKDLYVIFPRVTILDSNHGSLFFRKAKVHGLPATIIRPLREILEAPKHWMWVPELTLRMSDGRDVLLHHGRSSKFMAWSKNECASTIEGHFHNNFGVQHWSNYHSRYFSAYTGCLVDQQSLAYAYARNNLARFQLGSLIIIEGQPKLLPLNLNQKNRWDGIVP